MKQYIISEHLKTKKTVLRKLVLFIPALCALVTYSFNALGGEETIPQTLVTILNHWSLLWMPALIVLLTGLLHNHEKKSTQYKTIIGFPINLQSSWLAKSFLIASYTFFATCILGILISFLRFIIMSNVTQPVSLLNIYISLFFSWFLTLWQIPVCLWLAKKINYFILVIVNCIINLELGAGRAPSSNWWLSPWSWPLRVDAPLLRLHPNGIPLDSTSPLLSFNVIPIAVISACLLCILALFFTRKALVKYEVR
jgi:ABC-2 type transport system permease protein